jgi:hypothetical protein
VVLELLVDDVEDDGGDPRRRAVQERQADGGDGAQGRPDEGDEVAEGDEQGDHLGVGDADDPQEAVGGDAGDEADQEVAEHVAAHGPGGVSSHQSHPLAVAQGDEPEGAPAQLRTPQQHQEGEHQDREQREDPVEQAPDHAERRGAGAAERRLDPRLVVLHVLRQVVALDEAADGASTLPRVVD